MRTRSLVILLSTVTSLCAKKIWTDVDRAQFYTGAPEIDTKFMGSSPVRDYHDYKYLKLSLSDRDKYREAQKNLVKADIQEGITFIELDYENLRYIDQMYGIADGINEMIKAKRLKRKDFTVLYKLPTRDLGSYYNRFYYDVYTFLDYQLKTMKLIYFDLLAVGKKHHFTKDQGEVWAAAARFKKEGKALRIGLDRYDDDDLRNMIRTYVPQPDFNIIEVTASERQQMEKESLFKMVTRVPKTTWELPKRVYQLGRLGEVRSVDEKTALDIVRHALRVSKRLDILDENLGKRIRQAAALEGILLTDLTLIARLGNRKYAWYEVVPEVRRILDVIGVTRVDVLVLNSPGKTDADGALNNVELDYVDTWKQMQLCVLLGLTKYLGLENFQGQQLSRLLTTLHISMYDIYFFNKGENHYQKLWNRIKSNNNLNVTVVMYEHIGNGGTSAIWTKNELMNNLRWYDYLYAKKYINASMYAKQQTGNLGTVDIDVVKMKRYHFSVSVYGKINKMNMNKIKPPSLTIKYLYERLIYESHTDNHII